MGEGGKVADKERKGLGGKRGRGGYKARGWVRTFGAYKPRVPRGERAGSPNAPSDCTSLHKASHCANTKYKVQNTNTNTNTNTSLTWGRLTIKLFHLMQLSKLLLVALCMCNRASHCSVRSPNHSMNCFVTICITVH